MPGRGPDKTADRRQGRRGSGTLWVGRQGLTRLLMTRIPHFREVVIMAFECPHCHFRNSEIQSAGSIAEKGCTYTCTVTDSKDLDRQIVRSEWATVSVPEIQLDVPPSQEHGSLTTIEGFIAGCIGDLEMHQPRRQTEEPELYERLEGFLTKLRALLALEHPFNLVLDDPSGNSYIENLCGRAGPFPALRAERPLTAAAARPPSCALATGTCRGPTRNCTCGCTSARWTRSGSWGWRRRKTPRTPRTRTRALILRTVCTAPAARTPRPSRRAWGRPSQRCSRRRALTCPRGHPRICRGRCT